MRHLARPATSLATAVALALVACSAESGRTPFVSDAASEPAEAPPTSASPPKTSQSNPTTPTGDAGEPPPSDCTTTPPSHRCGLVAQCGCSATETCDVVDTKGSVGCVAFGRAPMGHPCTATAGCQRGLTCVFGTCHAYCDKPGAACGTPGTGACVQVNGPGDAPIPNLAVCRVRCAPHDPLSCGGATNAGTGVCFVDGEGGTDCQEGGARAENQACTATDGCGPALVCVTASSGTGTCKRWCRVGTADCGASVQCRSFASKVMVANVEYGACP